MEPTSTVIEAPWLGLPETRATIAALTRDGAAARFVGGAVRDTVVGRPVRDIDIATPLEPEAVMRLLRQAGIKAIPTGIAHGTVTAIAGGRHFEITTLRQDVRSDGRHAEVAFTGDWIGDASRRDFTINALYCDPDGKLFDPTGGLGDLERGGIRFIGNAEARIAEDALRILRFFRFHAWYGRGALDADGLAACEKRAPDLAILSAERVTAELRRLLAAPDPVAVLTAMATAGILGRVLPEAGDSGRLEGLVAVENEIGRADPWRRLMALVRVDAAGADTMARRLKLSRKTRVRLEAMAGPAPDVAPGAPANHIRRKIYRLGKATFIDRTMLAWAGQPSQAGWRALIDEAEGWQAPEFPVGGSDVLALGIDGPQVGEILRALETWWIDNDFPMEREVVLARLRAIVEQHRD